MNGRLWVLLQRMSPPNAMNAASNSQTDVLIVGAGPTGLVLALWLDRLGVRFRLVDKVAEPGTTSRALAVQGRTLEFYEQIGLADAVVEGGRKVPAVNLWVAGKNVARGVFGAMGAGLSPFPFALVFPQDEHEKLLIDRLAQQGVQVERQIELLDFEENGAGVLRARLQRPDGSIETCDAAYIAGCDGARSAVRDTLHIEFPGGTYTHLFYVADVEAAGEVINGELHAAFDATDFIALFPLKADGHARLVGTVREESEQVRENLSWNDVSNRVLGWMHIHVKRVNWFSTYRVHHRVADHFRRGRAFLLGDAAHIHSPVGGQGMNTGIGDAVNLAWKLAAVLQGRASESILDTFEPERIAFARRLVETTDRAFTSITSSSALARLTRLEIVPLFVPLLFEFESVRHFMFRTVSQIAVNYRDSKLSAGHAGGVHGGDRLPWVAPDAIADPKNKPNEDEDTASTRNATASGNFAPLTSLDWQVHVYGEAPPGLRTMCDARAMPLHVFPWRKEMEKTDLRRDAVYLVRPDGYVAVAEPESVGSVAAITSYLDANQIVPMKREN